ncbi:hypothetical protein [Rhodococcus tibetensis]|uniref:Uncharacterized protein n=1 Tax=Rhodococcus tibetensis TaxID=2965064 RepID=A0ABT1QEC9_9NOCA|nr:hypothetical protein [Rhodococcus sp. FXJ9.536]MCQ4120644.1 hypothetical protein [Rhodococcus sp. FXJ9.536]
MGFVIGFAPWIVHRFLVGNTGFGAAVAGGFTATALRARRERGHEELRGIWQTRAQRVAAPSVLGFLSRTTTSA